jgi:hypothetical protein
MNRKTRLSEIRKWRSEFISALEGAPVDKFILMRKQVRDGDVILTGMRGERRLNRKGAKKLMRIVEETIEEKLKG